MAKYRETIVISNELDKKIRKWLNNPETPEETLHEDETVTITAGFPNGVQMDIKCCGVQFNEDEDNSAWTEAVLFAPDGYEISCSEPADTFTGEWICEDGAGNIYTVIVKTIDI